MIEPLISATLPLLAQLVPQLIRDSAEDKDAVTVLKRIVENELRLNLAVLSSVLGDPGKLSSEDLTLIHPTVHSLQTQSAELIFGGMKKDIIKVGQLDKKTKEALESDANLQGRLPHQLRNTANLDFSFLLGHYIRKVAESKVITSIYVDFEPASKRKIQWAQRIQNLECVMLFLLKRLKAK